jgi:hypothetical protein
LNFSRSGASLSAGIRGARMTFGRTGTRTTVGLPGSGLSYTHLDPPPENRPVMRKRGLIWGIPLSLALWIALVSLVLWVLK